MPVMGKGEFERIADYFAPLAVGYPEAFGLRDDAALISHNVGQSLVVTTDTIVEGVHYIGDESADMIARKLLRVSLSDLAGMGAAPLAYTLNVTLPCEIQDQWLASFVSGLKKDQNEFEVDLIGGDSVSTTGPTVLSATLFGLVAKGQAVRRAGASIGDGIFVSGTIGDGALGLKVADGSIELADETAAREIVGRYRLPQPRCTLGLRLADVATAGADISDGLLADLDNITAASGVGAEIALDRVPLSSPAREILALHPDLCALVVTGGDDYELIFTSSKAQAVSDLSLELGLPITQIGTIVSGQGVKVLDFRDDTVPFDKFGYRHF
jgi:thiamine-monophosphate kinase